MDEFIKEKEQIINDFLKFRDSILRNHINLQRVYNILDELNVKKEGLLPATFYFNEYFPQKFGVSASRFLRNLLNDSGDLIKTLTTLHEVDVPDLAEIGFIAFKYEHLFDKIYGIYTESYNLINIWSASNRNGELLTSFKRIDNETFVLKLDIEDRINIINHFVDSLMNHYHREELEEIKDQIKSNLYLIKEDIEQL